MEKRLISANAVRHLCGGVSDMTLWRWLNDPALAFPRAVYICKRRYFCSSEIAAWMDAQGKTSQGVL